jgi:hypothetical protein
MKGFYMHRIYIYLLPDDGKSQKNRVILCVIHHRQNRLKSTYNWISYFGHPWPIDRGTNCKRHNGIKRLTDHTCSDGTHRFLFLIQLLMVLFR